MAMTYQKILITGASGQIGRVLRAGLRGKYELLRLLDIAPLGQAEANEELVYADIGDMAALEKAMEGIECVVHLAGVPVEDEWEKVLTLNIEGCYNTFEAARRQGVKRFIFASSNHAIGFHRRDRALNDQVMPRPDSRYGVSKVFGEALGRLYADKHGMQVACLRIGSFRNDNLPSLPRHLQTWISERDMVQLVDKCIDYPHYHFLIAYGISNNVANRWDNANVRFLGYQPQDDAQAYAAEIFANAEQEDPFEAIFHGGMFCKLEFSGDLDQID